MMADERGLGRLLTACGWERLAEEGDHDRVIMVTGGGRNCGKTAAMEATQFQRALAASIYEWATESARMADYSRRPDEAFAMIGDTLVDLDELRIQLNKAGIIVSIDRLGASLSRTALRADELLSVIHPEAEPAAATRDYLRHDPTKNTKRRMRRAKGRK